MYACVYIYINLNFSIKITVLNEIGCAWCITSNWLIKKILSFQFSKDYLDDNYLSFFSCFDQFSFKSKKKKGFWFVLFFPIKLPVLLDLASLYLYVINKSEYRESN